MITTSLRPFGTTIFSEMTLLAQEHGAINLAQGFPDFDGPPEILEAAHRAMREGHNQYARSQGHPLLVKAVAEKARRLYGLEPDPMREVAVFSGATEGIASTLLGLLEPGDEVVMFEPFYDSYPAMVARAGATARFCTLRFPEMSFDPDELRALFGPRTRMVLLNTPHNPTGKVFTRAELEVIAGLCRERNVLVLADEVYEHLTYGDAVHVPIATLPGMWERTVTMSSAGKTYSLTGWKVGWAIGPAELIAAAQAAHQFVTFATATPLQVAVAWAIGLPERYLAQLKVDYTRRRDLLLDAVRAAGFRPAVPEGTYFILADFSGLSRDDDRAFARELTARHGVAVIPPSVFYARRPEEGRRLLRFAFCKQEETLRAAASKLAGLRS